MRLHLPDFGDHVARGLGEVVMRGLAAQKAARLKPVKRPLLAQKMREMAQVEHIAEHARDQEEGRAGTAFAPVHRHEMGEAARRLRGSGCRARLLRADARLDQPRAGADGGGLEQDRDGEIDAIGLADHGKEPHGDERMAAEVEEGVLGPHLRNAQKLGPEPGQADLDLALGGDEIAVELGPVEPRARLRLRQRRIGLADQRGQVERGDEHLRQVERAGAAERFGPLGGADAFAQVVQKPRLGGAFGGVRAGLYADLAGARRGDGKPALLPAQREIADLGQNLSLRIGEGDVEACRAASGAGIGGDAHMAQDRGRERREDPDRAIGHRHPERAALVAINQAHGPAGGDVEQRRMQDIALVPRGGSGQAEPRQPLAPPEAHGAQHLPARAEGKMRRLRAGNGGRAFPPVIEPRADRLRVERGGGLHRQDRHLRLGQGQPAPAPRLRGLCLEPRAIARGAARERQAHLARGVVGQIEGAQEEQVADLEHRALALRAERLGQKLDIARAGQKRRARPGAMLVEDPVRPAAVGGVKAPVARPIKPHRVDERGRHREARCLGGRAVAGGDGLGGHARLGPDPPVERQHARPPARPRAGIGVEILVGRDIIHLTGGRGGGGAGGKQHEPVGIAVGKHLFQHLRAVDLGGEDILDRLGALGEKWRVGDGARRVDDARYGAERGLDARARGLHLLDIAHVARKYQDLPAKRLEPLDGGDAAGERAARGQMARPAGTRRQRGARQKGDARPLARDQILGQGKTDAAEPAGDQHGAALGHGRCGGKRQGPPARLVAPRPAQRGDAGARRLHHFLQDLRNQRAPLRFRGQHQIDACRRHARHLARDDAQRPGDGGLGRVGQRLVPDLRRAGGEGGDVAGRYPLLGQRLRQKEQAVEALFLHPVEKARTGAVAFVRRHQPEMGDAAGRAALRQKRRDERVIPFAPAFGREGVAIRGEPRETVARRDGGDGMARSAEPRGDLPGQAGFVGEDKPCLGRPCRKIGVGRDLDLGQTRGPVRGIAPVAQILAPGGPRLGHGLRRGGGDEIGLVLKRVGGQRHAVAPRLAPDLRPVDLHPHGPEPRQHGHEIFVIGDGILGVAQGADDLIGADRAMRLCERGERLAGADLQEDAGRGLCEPGQPVGEAHRVPQMSDPIGGVGGLFRREIVAGAIGQDGDLRRAQRDAAQVGAEAVKDRLQHPAMRGDVDGDAARLDPVGAQAGVEIVKRGLRPRNGGELRRVERRDVERAAEIGRHGLGRKRHAEHPAPVHRVEELPAQMHQPDAILEAHHPGQTGGGVLAHGMTDQGGRRYPPALPELRQRVFGDHDQRQLHRGALEPLLRRRFPVGLRQPERADVVIEPGAQDIEAAIHPVCKDRLGLVKVARHARILRAAAGKHEDHIRVVERLMGEDAARIARLQPPGGFVLAAGDGDAAMLEGAAALLEREGHIGQRLFGMGAQVIGKAGCGRVERGFRARRDHQRLKRPVALFRGGARRGLFQHHMGVGAADAQGIDARAAGMAAPGPGGQAVIDGERAAVETDGGIGGLVAQRGRDLGVMKRQRGLDQAGHPGGRVEMADIGLDAADAAEIRGLGRLAERLRQRRHLDGIAQIGAGAVALDVIHRVGGDPGHGLRLGHRRRLPVHGGREIARLGRAVVVHRRALDDGPDVIPIGQRIGEPPQHDHPRTRPEDGALRAVIEGVAFSIGRQDLALLVEIAVTLRQLDGHAARKRHVALAVEQRLRRVMHRDERGGTGGLQAERRPLEIEDVAQPGGQEILVIAGMAQEEHPHIVHKIAVRAEVEIEIAAHAAAREDADGAGEMLGHVARILERLPGDFQKAAVLRVEDRGLLRAEAEELGIEHLDALERRGEGHVIGAAQGLRRHARRDQFRLVEAADGAAALAQHLPIPARVPRPGQVRGHADDRDLGPVGGAHAHPVGHRNVLMKS